MARVLLLALLLAATPFAAVEASLSEDWLRVQQALADPTPEGIEEKVGQLRESAAEVTAERLTPYAAALVSWASERPDAVGDKALKLARDLDPILPAVDFLKARRQWSSGSYLGATAAYFSGWIKVARCTEVRSLLLTSCGAWWLLALGLMLASAIVPDPLLSFRHITHDALELGRVLFKGANAYVFGTVVVLLPLFAALGPTWVVAYLFVLSWAYIGKNKVITGIVVCFVLGLLVPALDWWQQAALQQTPVTGRVVRMLEERQVDPATLREFADLDAHLGGVARYHLLLGELMRLHGDLSQATTQFQQASLGGDVVSAVAHLCLGNLAMEDSDIHRAMQEYNAALEKDPELALGHLNLSFALDQSLRFSDGDAERQKSWDISRKRPEDLGMAGKAARVRYPFMGADDVERMVADASPEARLAAALEPVKPRPLSRLLNPFTLVFWVSALLGGILLFARRRWMWAATACSRCGKIFCPRCKSSTESSTYCSQCISVFLKRDVVAMDQQQVKLRQIRKWEARKGLVHRILAGVLPGMGLMLTGKVWLGIGIGFATWWLLLCAVMWLPGFVASVVPLATLLPLQVIALLGCAVLWFRSARAVWSGR